MLMFGMRLGADPRTVVTTTPRPAKLIRDLVRDPMDPSSLGMGGARSSPDRADALVWAFTELLVEEIESWGIYEVTRRKAEALVKERLAAVEAGRPKSEFAPGSQEYQALHPEWKPQDGGESY